MWAFRRSAGRSPRSLCQIERAPSLWLWKGRCLRRRGTTRSRSGQPCAGHAHISVLLVSFESSLASQVTGLEALPAVASRTPCVDIAVCASPVTAPACSACTRLNLRCLHWFRLLYRQPTQQYQCPRILPVSTDFEATFASGVGTFRAPRRARPRRPAQTCEIVRKLGARRFT